jgi:hypothetical protein
LKFQGFVLEIGAHMRRQDRRQGSWPASRTPHVQTYSKSDVSRHQQLIAKDLEDHTLQNQDDKMQSTTTFKVTAMIATCQRNSSHMM